MEFVLFYLFYSWSMSTSIHNLHHDLEPHTVTTATTVNFQFRLDKLTSFYDCAFFLTLHLKTLVLNNTARKSIVRWCEN